MDNGDMTTPQGEPPCAAGPLPFFAVGREWYSRIRAASLLDCGAALKLMAFCAEQGNGGLIADCRGWSAALWHKNAGICSRGPRGNAFLSWQGEGLRVLCGSPAAAPPACSGAAAGQPVPRTEKGRRKEKEKQKEKGRGKEIAPAGGLSRVRLPYPEDPLTVQELMRRRAGCQLPPDSLQLCARDFLDTMEARGWLDTRGQQVTDWRPCAAKFARSWAEIRQRAELRRSGFRPVNMRNENANKQHVQDYGHP